MRKQTSTPRKRARPRTPAAVFTPELRSPGKVRGPRADRTIAAILAATRQIFLTRGFAGTAIDDITTAAGVSRSSFYTYFPSKRAVLLAMGLESANAAAAIINKLDAFPPKWKIQDLEEWVRGYFEVLDSHGSFAFAWTQAAHEDEELRRAGMAGHLALCRQFGEALEKLGGHPIGDVVESGLLAFSVLERAWVYCDLYERTINVSAVQRTIAQMLRAMARHPRS